MYTVHQRETLRFNTERLVFCCRGSLSNIRFGKRIKALEVRFFGHGFPTCLTSLLFGFAWFQIN